MVQIFGHATFCTRCLSAFGMFGRNVRDSRVADLSRCAMGNDHYARRGPGFFENEE